MTIEESFFCLHNESVKKQSLSGLVRHFFHPCRSNNHRPKILHPDALLSLVVFLGSSVLLLKGVTNLTPGWEKVLGFASNITSTQVVSQTNKERAKLGLEPLQLNSTLSQAALAKGQDMFNDQYWAHTAPDGTEPWYFMKSSGYNYIVAGENLARDFAETNSMVSAWMASPTHRANIVNPRYHEIGIAVIDGVLEGYETTLVVQMFGTRVNGQVAEIGDQAPTTQRYAFLPGQDQPQVAVSKFTLPQISDNNQPSTESVLASALVPVGQLKASPIFSPLQLSKAIILLVLILIAFTLIYDMFVIGHFHTMRLVGKNIAHIILLGTVIFLVIFFKGGVVG